jgi:hypothetical protein
MTTLMESARSFIDRSVLSAPAKLEIKEQDFTDKVILPSLPLAGQVADLVTTKIGLDRGFEEGNPFAKGLVQNMPLFAVTKLALGVGLGVVVSKMHNKGHKRAASILGALTGFLPAASNVVLLAKKK